MSDFSQQLLAVGSVAMMVGGIGLAAVGVYRKRPWDAGVGLCFLVSGLLRYRGQSDAVATWMQLVCSIALAGLVIGRLAERRRAAAKSSGRQDQA